MTAQEATPPIDGCAGTIGLRTYPGEVPESRYAVLLLRAINGSPADRLFMADLRHRITRCGLADVTTQLPTGMSGWPIRSSATRPASRPSSTSDSPARAWSGPPRRCGPPPSSSNW